jgi:hypothetical protein
VATTRRGRYCLKRAQERITRRKPIARTCSFGLARWGGERGNYKKAKVEIWGPRRLG